MRRAASVLVLVVAVAAAAALAALAYRGSSGAEGSSELAEAAVALFEESHSVGATAEERRRAEAAARALRDRGGDASARSLGANLLGVLAFENASLDKRNAAGHAAASVGAFREAIRLDAANDDAKFNLELALTLADDAAAASGAGASGRAGSSGAGAGATPPGRGY